MTPSNFAWSYSALTNYETCPKKHYHYNIAKDISEPTNESMSWGFAVHAALAARINKMRPLPDTMKKYEPWVDWAFKNVDRTKNSIVAEQKLAFTASFEPCDYFDKVKKPWCRTVVDVLKINGPVARVIDWKTGKVKDDSTQLGLCATAVFAHYPAVQAVACNFAWLQDDQDPTNPHEVQPEIMERKHLPQFWRGLITRVNALGYSIVNSEFPPKPSGLCKRNCAVVSCPYHGKGSY